MRYEGQLVTLDNYKVIFNNCIPDILDEIRLAILDNINIFSYIDICGSDSYKLGQIRLSIREGISRRYINSQFTGKTLRNIRYCISNGIDVSNLYSYVSVKTLRLSPILLEKLSEVLVAGGSISNIDFTTVSSDNFDIICNGLIRQYPMWLFTDSNLTVSIIKLYMRGIDLGIDITKFLGDDWSEDKLILLFSYVNSVDLGVFLGMITYLFNRTQIEILLKAYSGGIDISRIVIRDMDGYPVYNEYQMQVLLDAEKCGIYSPDLYNPKLNDMDMREILEKITETIDK